MPHGWQIDRAAFQDPAKPQFYTVLLTTYHYKSPNFGTDKQSQPSQYFTAL